MDRVLSDQAVVAAARDQVSSDLGGEAVILHLASGTYYSLNEVGARVWELLQERSTIGALCARIVAEYEVDPERCAADVRHLVESLAREGLVEISGDRAA